MPLEEYTQSFACTEAISELEEKDLVELVFRCLHQEYYNVVIRVQSLRQDTKKRSLK